MLDKIKSLFGGRAEEAAATINIEYDLKSENYRAVADEVWAWFADFLREYVELEESTTAEYMRACDERSAYDKQQGRQSEAMKNVTEAYRDKKKRFLEPHITEKVSWRSDFQKPSKFASINSEGHRLTFTMKSERKITIVLATGSETGIARYRFTLTPREGQGWLIDSFGYSFDLDGGFSKLDL